jgi:hypothetical protein
MDFNKAFFERVDLVPSTADIAHYVAFVNTEMNFWSE